MFEKIKSALQNMGHDIPDENINSSRRDFLKKGAMGVAGIAAATILPGTANAGLKTKQRKKQSMPKWINDIDSLGLRKFYEMIINGNIGDYEKKFGEYVLFGESVHDTEYYDSNDNVWMITDETKTYDPAFWTLFPFFMRRPGKSGSSVKPVDPSIWNKVNLIRKKPRFTDGSNSSSVNNPLVEYNSYVDFNKYIKSKNSAMYEFKKAIERYIDNLENSNYRYSEPFLKTLFYAIYGEKIGEQKFKIVDKKGTDKYNNNNRESLNTLKLIIYDINPKSKNFKLIIWTINILMNLYLVDLIKFEPFKYKNNMQNAQELQACEEIKFFRENVYLPLIKSNKNYQLDRNEDSNPFWFAEYIPDKIANAALNKHMDSFRAKAEIHNSGKSKGAKLNLNFLG